MKFLRKIVLKLFGLRGYVRIVSAIYLVLVKTGFMKKKYPELFYLSEIVKPGFICIDIGANVGYYSFFLSKYAGNEGEILAVEPIPLFAEIWKKNVKPGKRKNLKLFNCALGGESTMVQMGIPEVDGVLHHGMTKIVSTREEKYVKFYDVEMKVPDKLFADLDRIDFIKCDVEGYESIVFGNMLNVIRKHKPLIQSELSGNENRNRVIDLLLNEGYALHVLKDKKLVPVSREEAARISSDFYFSPVIN